MTLATTHRGTDTPRAEDPAVRASTRAAFLVAGLAMAAWAPLVPYAKVRAGLDDGALGLLLLCLGAGSLVAMPTTGGLVARFGCRAVVLAAACLVCAVLPVLASGGSFAVLAVALLLFGAGIGMIDVAMNVQAVIVEKASGRAMMSGFHGFFSVGGIAGAGGMAGLLWAGLSPLAATFAVIVVVLGLLAVYGRHLLSYGSEDDGAPFFVVPRGSVLVIGLLCCLCFLAEGAMLDWSAVFLTTARDMAPALAGLGYAAFNATMTVGRLTGDRMIEAAGGQVVGGRRVLVLGSLCASAGLVLAVAVPSAAASLAGFALVGLGASNIVPVLFSALGRQTAMPQHLAIAAATTLGYAGILAGPALIGFAAAATSLSAALLGVAALLLLIAANARIVRS